MHIDKSTLNSPSSTTNKDKVISFSERLWTSVNNYLFQGELRLDNLTVSVFKE